VNKTPVAAPPPPRCRPPRPTSLSRTSSASPPPLFAAAPRRPPATFALTPLYPFPVVLFSLVGAAKGKSNFGTLPAVYPSPSLACLHGLGGLQLLAQPKMDKAGVIIGVSMVFVNCPQCKGAPYLVGKYKGTGKMQTKTRTISLKKELPAARALFAKHGKSLFKGQGAVEPMADDE